MKRVIGLLVLCVCSIWLPVRAADPAEPPTDYHRAKWDPIHFKPAIDKATDADCLACHAEVLKPSVSAKSPAGVAASEALAWYQTLDTYKGDQETLHRRHIVTDYATQVMDMKCTTCHQGNDPREETANSSANGDPTLTQRKHVDPNICLMCHGKHNATVMGVPPGDWREVGVMFSYNCLTCHVAIRTARHEVNFLKPKAIEAAGQADPDVCFGCHGGRAWYRIPYPYARHVWPGSGDVVPEWAKERPTKSDPRFLTGVSAAKP
jgi:hypothetical protein